MTARRLAAILAADVVGFSRLIGADEAATLGRLRALRSEVIDPLLAEHGGRLFKTTGDGLLAEFPSAVQALRCAIAIQSKQRATENALAIRIGLHQGDVVIEGEDLLGDGVNIAARLEPLAEPHGIVISARVREDAQGKLDLACEDLGTPALKNIASPIQVHRVRLDTPDRSAQPLALPEKPSLVVLPFQNMSGDPEQEYFADGMVEDITTALSRIGGLFVIARNSAFTYKGKPIDVKAVGRELGVRYVVEGSVRKAGGRVRITAQLIEAASATHLWADRFDGALDDIFDLQDRVAEKIVGAVEPSLKRAEISRAVAKLTGSLDAYDLYLRALPDYYSLARPRLDRCLGLLREALALAPGFTLARALLANAYCMRHHIGGAAPGDEAVAVGLAHEVVAARTDDPDALRLAGVTLGYFATDFPLSLATLRRALLLHPNSAQVLSMLGWAENWAGEAQSAEEHFRRAMHLSPLDPEIGLMLGGIGIALLMLDRDAEALEVLERAVVELPNFTANHSNLILALHRLGRLDDAKAAAERLLAHQPDYRVRGSYKSQFNARYKADRYEALLAAGLRE